MLMFYGFLSTASWSNQLTYYWFETFFLFKLNRFLIYFLNVFTLDVWILTKFSNFDEYDWDALKELTYMTSR